MLNPFHFKGERGLFHDSIRNIRDCVDSKRRFDLALERRYFSRESRACWSWSIFNIDQHGMIKPYQTILNHIYLTRSNLNTQIKERKKETKKHINFVNLSQLLV